MLPDLFHPESLAKVSMLNGTLATFSSLFPQSVLTKVAKSDVALPYYISGTAMAISAVVMTIGLTDVIKQDQLRRSSSKDESLKSSVKFE